MTNAEVGRAEVRYDVFPVGRDRPAPGETLLDQLEEVVRRVGDRLAVVDERRQLTYRQLWDNAARIAGSLRQAGCGDGDRICIDLPNSVEWVQSLLGVLRAGCVAVPLDQRATERHRALVHKDSQARLTLGVDTALDETGGYDHWPQADDLALLLYTSGTTGTPKGVMLSHAALASYKGITSAYLRRDPIDEPFRNLVAIPLCHSAGCNTQLLPTLALGGTVVIAPGSGPSSILKMLDAWEPDVMFAVPVLYRRLLDETEHNRSPLRCLRDVHFGAASTPQTLVRELRAALPWARLGNAFGMTEISNVALFLPDEHLESSAGSVGFPVPGVECQIRDADASGRGALYLRGPNLARGYWQRPELTSEIFGTGWVRSGDLAEIGPDGAIYLRDRTDDVINRGGEKIYSIAVEEALLELPGVVEAAVVGRPDQEMGTRVAALIVGETRYDTTGLREALSGRLPVQAIPEDVISRSEPLPRGTSGKVLKQAVVDCFNKRQTNPAADPPELL